MSMNRSSGVATTVLQVVRRRWVVLTLGLVVLLLLLLLHHHHIRKSRPIEPVCVPGDTSCGPTPAWLVKHVLCFRELGGSPAIGSWIVSPEPAVSQCMPD